MMKRLFSFLAAMLLMSASAMAQGGKSEPVRGDVNGDGVVNGTDIQEVINIIVNGPEYKPRTDGTSPYIYAVDEYVPAPGQFVNTMPQYEEGDDAAAMARKCTEYLANKENGSLVTLGAYGGYITFHFDHSVKNVPGEYDLLIKGNAYYQTGSTLYGSFEPGVVMVSEDTNNNGLPDDEWFELSGSADVDSVGKVIYGYECTYTYAAMSDIPWSWSDNMSNSGTVDRNTFHAQEYFPLWQKDKEKLTFCQIEKK